VTAPAGRTADDRRVALIIQVRMGSTRLPGKSLLDLAGAPLVGRILERVRRCANVHTIVLATTKRPEDDVLAALAARYGCCVFRGAENDLVDRYYRAARAAGADVIVRLPGDNPVPEPDEIDRIIAFHLTGQSDFSSNLSQIAENGYPDGIGAEVFDTRVLEDVWRTAGDPRRREHPHLNFFDYATQQAAAPGTYRIGTVQCPAEFRRPDLVLDVNTREEYEFMADLYSYLYPRNPQFGIVDIIRWYDTVYHGGGGRGSSPAVGSSGAPARS
jgi:spore coat polysaccharide biosynthesis protein SpsF